MAKQTLNNGESGSVIRGKINDNFTEVYTAAADKWALTGTSTLTGAVTVVGTTTNTIKYLFDSLAVTQVNGAGLWLANTTAAAAGAQQISPSLVWEGQGWKTNATAASQSVKFKADVLPVQAAANPSATWRLSSSINAGAYSDILSVSSDANVGTTLAGNFLTFSAANPIVLLGQTSGAIRFPGSGQGTINYNVTSVLPSATGFISLRNFAANITATSGTASEIGIGSGFAPASGTTVYNMVVASQTINSASSGLVTFFNIAPTITAAANLVGFDWNPSGNGSGFHYAIRARRGDITIEDSAKGLILKDTQGTPHYWRIQVDNTGNLTTTDLGTSI